MGKKILKDENQPSRLGKPRVNYVKSLTKMSQRHYTMLERACVEAYLTKNYRVTLTVSYLTELPDDFPRPFKKIPDGVNNHLILGARSLLQWLNKHGYSTITAESIRQSLVDFTLKTKGLIDELDSL